MGGILARPIEPRFVIGTKDRQYCLEVVDPFKYGSVLRLNIKNIHNRYQKSVFKKSDLNEFVYWRLDDHPQPPVVSNGKTVVMQKWYIEDSDAYLWKIIPLFYSEQCEQKWHRLKTGFRLHRDDTEGKNFQILLYNKRSGYLSHKEGIISFTNKADMSTIWEMEYVCSCHSAAQIVNIAASCVSVGVSAALIVCCSSLSRQPPMINKDVTRSIPSTQASTCYYCGGKGWVDTIGDETCFKCAGTGRDVHSDLWAEPCGRCDGKGTVTYARREPCRACS